MKMRRRLNPTKRLENTNRVARSSPNSPAGPRIRLHLWAIISATASNPPVKSVTLLTPLSRVISRLVLTTMTLKVMTGSGLVLHSMMSTSRSKKTGRHLPSFPRRFRRPPSTELTGTVWISSTHSRARALLDDTRLNSNHRPRFTDTQARIPSNGDPTPVCPVSTKARLNGTVTPAVCPRFPTLDTRKPAHDTPGPQDPLRSKMTVL